MNSEDDSFPFEQALKKLKEFDCQILDKKNHFIGYPMNGDIHLDRFFEWWAQSSASHAPLNDVGNPYEDLPQMINCRPFERAVLKTFSERLKFPEDSSWGYITSGGTLSNEQGLLIGRERLKKKGKPILYFSIDSHYSLITISQLLALDYRLIPSLRNGEIDCVDLEAKLDTSRPALINLNFGTTFKGAIDSMDLILKALSNKKITDFYIHVDAALFGGYFPFIDNKEAPALNFETMPFDSVAISGHKFFGSPIPMGIFLVRKKHIEQLENDFIEYIDTKNMTIPCSRASFNTLLFWWILETKAFGTWEKETKSILDRADYLHNRLRDREKKVWKNPYSNIVYFEAPSPELCKKWSLAQQHCPVLGHLAHIVVMQHVTKEILDLFLHDST